MMSVVAITSPAVLESGWYSIDEAVFVCLFVFNLSFDKALYSNLEEME